jgi:integrase
MVVASVVDEQTGEEMYPRKWNPILIDAPVVDKKKQKTPIFSGEIVTGIISKCPERYRTLFALCAASGLRMGEALGIDIKDVSPDGSVIKIRQKAWKGQIHDYLKTINGEREVDLHSSVAKLVKKYVGIRQSGLLFCTRTGKQLSQSNILRRGLHPTLKELKWQDSESGIKQAGSHAFRRFRNTYLRNHTLTPDGVIKFWMGHAGENMSDLYDKIRQDMQFRREVVEKAGLGFEISLQKAVVGPNGPKIKSKSPLEGKCLIQER